MLGLLIRAICIFLAVYSTCSIAQNVKTYIPPQAYQYFSTIKEEALTNIPNFYMDSLSYFPALIEHESCLSLTHSRCWNPTSRLKSAREEGAGLGQITKAYTKTGKLRFDTLSDLRRRYMSQLKELSWSNVYQRPDLQIRAIILLTKSNFDKINIRGVDPIEKIAFTDAAYNGGLGGVTNERRACGLAKDCNPDRWFDHTERYCLKSPKALYGRRSACVINRHHVRDVMLVRMSKYQSHFVIEKKGIDTPIVKGPISTPYSYLYLD